MNRVIAAVHDPDAVDGIVAAARRLADSNDASLEVAYVTADDEPISQDLAVATDGIARRLLHGEPASALVEMACDPLTTAIAMGVRDTIKGPLPAGHVTLEVLASSDCPVLVVPTTPIVTGEGPYQRVLAPLEGSRERSGEVERRIRELLPNVDEVIALHVFDEQTVPAFWDQSHHEMEAWGEQFRAEHLPPAVPLLVAGDVGSEILEAVDRENIDLIVLVWAQRLAPGRAAVVRRLLISSPVPVLLIPDASAETEMTEVEPR